MPFLPALVLAALAVQPLPPDAPTQAERSQRALAHYKAGQEALRGERFDDAERELRHAVMLDPLVAMAHYELGRTYMATRRYPEAVVALRGARASFEAIAALVARRRAAGERLAVHEARALDDAVLALRALQEHGALGAPRLEAQREKVRAALVPEPDDVRTPAPVLLALGSAYFHLGALAEAEAAYREAAATDPTLGEAHNNLGVVYLMTGRGAEAARAVDRARRAGYAVDPRLLRDIEKRLAR
jgi:tetratricopeptide (TPR) repeat protein